MTKVKGNVQDSIWKFHHSWILGVLQDRYPKQKHFGLFLSYLREKRKRN